MVREKYIRCPFWRRTNDPAYTVGCEGLIDRSTLLMRFERAEDREIHARAFCAGRYENCELYHAILEARYQED